MGFFCLRARKNGTYSGRPADSHILIRVFVSVDIVSVFSAHKQTAKTHNACGCTDGSWYSLGCRRDVISQQTHNVVRTSRDVISQQTHNVVRTSPRCHIRANTQRRSDVAATSYPSKHITSFGRHRDVMYQQTHNVVRTSPRSKHTTSVWRRRDVRTTLCVCWDVLQGHIFAGRSISTFTCFKFTHMSRDVRKSDMCAQRKLLSACASAFPENLCILGCPKCASKLSN